jgi:hypothetical protein
MRSELGQLFSDGLSYFAAIFDAKKVVVMPDSYITAILQTTGFVAARSIDSTGELRKESLDV